MHACLPAYTLQSQLPTARSRPAVSCCLFTHFIMMPVAGFDGPFSNRGCHPRAVLCLGPSLSYRRFPLVPPFSFPT